MQLELELEVRQSTVERRRTNIMLDGDRVMVEFLKTTIEKAIESRNSEKDNYYDQWALA